MTLQPFMPSIATDVRTVINSKLAALEQAHNVRILFAVESGSRAWGFPCPDSDYDVRFVYMHEVDWYLGIEPARDVIELPIEGDWDINGWDIRKALGLLIKPNPVLLEWLSSPIRYRWNETACQTLSAFAAKTAYGEACLHHYRNLALKQWNRHVANTTGVALKKYFYILRPALAIAWIRQTPDLPPPVNIQALVAGQKLPPSLVFEIQNLLDLKSTAKEIGLGARIPDIDDFIHDQLEWAKVVPKLQHRPDLLHEGNVIFRNLLRPAR